MFGNQYDDKEVRVKLICERKQGIINKFIDKFGQDLKIYPENEEKMTILFNAFPSEGLLIWLMQFGPSIEVITPKSLRDKIREMILKMADMYKKE